MLRCSGFLLSFVSPSLIGAAVDLVAQSGGERVRGHDAWKRSANGERPSRNNRRMALVADSAARASETPPRSALLGERTISQAIKVPSLASASERRARPRLRVAGKSNALPISTSRAPSKRNNVRLRGIAYKLPEARGARSIAPPQITLNKPKPSVYG